MTSTIVEVAVRNPSVMEYMKHWEGRALKAEAALTALSHVQAPADPWQHVREAINHCIDLPLDGYQPSITQETAAAAISCVDMFEALGFPVGKIFPPDNEAMAFTWEHGGKKLYITSSHEDDRAYFLNALASPAPQVDEAMVERGKLLRHFVSMFKSGAQGCEMDWEGAQALALAIEAAIGAKP